MSYILALFLPGVAVMVKGRVLTGLLLLLLQFTVIGWIPACFVAFAIINEQNRRQDMRQMAKHTPPLRVPWP